MNYTAYEQYIDKETTGRYDVTPLFSDATAFSSLIDDLGKPFSDFDKVAGLDALGFIIGGALAQKEKVGFIPIRKGGKLPGKEVLRTSFVDYTGKEKSFELNKKTIKKGEKVLLVDEWIETGAQMKAAISLIEKAGGVVAGISVLSADEKVKNLFEKYTFHAINHS